MDENEADGIEEPSSIERSDEPLGAAENESPKTQLKLRRARRAAIEDHPPEDKLSPAQRLLLLDVWARSEVSAQQFGEIAGVSQHTLYAWKKRFEKEGPAGLVDRPKGVKGGSKLPEATQRAILLMKRQHPEWGCERIRDMLMRCEGYGASPNAILRVLRDDGLVAEEEETEPHAPMVHRFERARPNQLWQSDLFTFLLKRENRRVYLVAFLDDHSRFVVGYGVWASASGALVREVLEAAIANFGAPEEVLTDNGPQYVTWRGKSGFTKLLDRRGIKHIKARAKHPQTVGKCERFWGSLWRECLKEAVLSSIDEARKRIGLFIDHYNFQRPHQGIEGLVPADRFFEAAPEVKATLAARVAANALELAQHGTPRKSFYLTGRVGDAGISVHTEGSRVVLTGPGGGREEVDLEASGRRADPGEIAELPEPVAVAAREREGYESEEELDPDGDLP